MRIRCIHWRVVSACTAVALLAACGGSGTEDGVPENMTLTAQAVTPGEVQLTWTPYIGDGDYYEVYRDGVGLNVYLETQTSYADREVQPDTEYCYKIYRTGYLATDGMSNTACVTTPGIAGWTIQTVGQGASPSLVLDASGQPLVSYAGSAGVTLATSAEGAWQSSVVDDGSGGAGDTGLAQDRNGGNHIVYWDSRDLRMRVTSDATGVWISELVDSSVTPGLIGLTGNSGGYINAMALDSGGSTRLLSSGNEVSSITYSTNQGGAWENTRVATFINANIYDTDIQLDNSGAVHGVAAVGIPQDCSVYYVTNSGGQWSSLPVTSDSNCGAALARDSAGTVHVVYSRSNALTHAWYSGGVWQSETVDTFSALGGDRVALAVDDLNHLHIAYRDQSFDLKYATNASGAWERIFVDSVGSVGFSPSIAVNAQGRVMIAYVDETTIYIDQVRQTVKFAISP